MTQRATPQRQQRFEVDDATIWPERFAKWNFAALYSIFLYLGACFVLATQIPNSFWDNELKKFVYIMGALGVWRYSWWFTHAVRAVIYGKIIYPRMRLRGQRLWEKGWRPAHLHFMLTTYYEHRDITEKVIRSICLEIKDSGVPGTIWLGSSVRFDEDIVINFLRREFSDLDVTLRIIRQNVPGKRAAIGLVLRAMSRGGVHRDELVTFMDGDFILERGAIGACMPLFGVYPDLQAVTTDEEVICIGPRWVELWLEMRFAQRRLAMQSHSVSNRVLTLTGRMSVFRANHLLKKEFIRTLEADHLRHWLWGEFRFLSGDDKSTWYHLLSKNAQMLYVPDARGYTVEVIDGSGLERMVQNFRRWSGNMLRNGSRAIALGPRRMPFFIWWCLIDQRLSMWTMLFSPVLAVSASILLTPYYLVAYALFIAVSRMLLSLVLYNYSRRISITIPLILYFNQLINASVKVYCFYRLAKQKWSNRGNQSTEQDGSWLVQQSRNYMAMYCTAVGVMTLFTVVIMYSGLLTPPAWSDFIAFYGR